MAYSSAQAQCLAACRCCGLIHAVPSLTDAQEARCARCGTRLRRTAGSRSLSLTAALCLAALILFPVAMALPVLELSKLGHVRQTTIWGGVVDLLADGHVVIGMIVLTCSVIIPPTKLLGMLALCGRGRFLDRRHHAVTYRTIDWLGRWGMIDVLLVAVLIAAVKLGNWVNVTPGPGIIAFAGVVLLSLLASATFDPTAVWDETR